MLIQKLSEGFSPNADVSAAFLEAGITYKNDMHWYVGTHWTSPYPEKTKYLKAHILTKEPLSKKNLKKLGDQFLEVRLANAMMYSIHKMLKSMTTEYQILSIIEVHEPPNISVEWAGEDKPNKNV